MTPPAMSAAPLWGVGSYEAPDGRVAWEISHAEIQRDIGNATRTLDALGLGRGTRVLLCSMLSEAGQFWPLTVGAMLAGSQLSCADASESDASRVAMFMRFVDYHAVLGITGAILDGLDALGREYGDVFGGVAVLGARPDAHARLADAGLRPHHFVLCGPALAIGTEPEGPAVADDREWELDSDDDQVAVTNRQPRATAFTRTVTAVRGEMREGGLVPMTAIREDRR
jgi:hypothetical protein